VWSLRVINCIHQLEKEVDRKDPFIVLSL
jgi:hypothetical protein